MDRWLKSSRLDLKVPLTRSWINFEHTNYMYTEEQQRMQWAREVYTLCPLFIDFPQDRYPLEEKAAYMTAQVEKKARLAKEVYQFIFARSYKCAHIFIMLSL